MIYILLKFPNLLSLFTADTDQISSFGRQVYRDRLIGHADIKDYNQLF